MEDKKVKNFRYFHANIDIPLLYKYYTKYWKSFYLSKGNFSTLNYINNRLRLISCSARPHKLRILNQPFWTWMEYSFSSIKQNKQIVGNDVNRHRLAYSMFRLIRKNKDFSKIFFKMSIAVVQCKPYEYEILTWRQVARLSGE